MEANKQSSIVVSVFAIVILSIIGALFKTNNHTMMGSEDDPKVAGAVAGAVFGAVFIYLVGLIDIGDTGEYGLTSAGLLRVLRFPSLPPHQRKPPGRYKPVMIPNSLKPTS